jgi:hypothetical protein
MQFLLLDYPQEDWTPRIVIHEGEYYGFYSYVVLPQVL